MSRRSRPPRELTATWRELDSTPISSQDWSRHNTEPILWPIYSLAWIGLAASAVFTVSGPWAWWINYLAAGLVWGVTWLPRTFIRLSLRGLNRSERLIGQSWLGACGDAARGAFSGGWLVPFMALGAIPLFAAFWPVIGVYGAYLHPQMDNC
jgi:hypothetical protein